MATYKIIRFRLDGHPRVMHTGLSLAEAQEHCKKESTHKIDTNGEVKWFDGYIREE